MQGHGDLLALRVETLKWERLNSWPPSLIWYLSKCYDFFKSSRLCEPNVASSSPGLCSSSGASLFCFRVFWCMRRPPPSRAWNESMRRNVGGMSWGLWWKAKGETLSLDGVATPTSLHPATVRLCFTTKLQTPPEICWKNEAKVCVRMCMYVCMCACVHYVCMYVQSWFMST